METLLWRARGAMAYAIKAKVDDPGATNFLRGFFDA